MEVTIGKHQLHIHQLKVVQVLLILLVGTKLNITLTTIQVGKQLNLTTRQKHLQSIIGMAQLGFLNRRLKWPDQMAV